MRDIILLCVLPFLLYATLKRPFIGLGLWIWTAMFYPNAWVYGMAAGIRYNLLISASAILSYLCSPNKKRFEVGNTGAFVLLFFAWTTVTSVFAMAMPDRVWGFWNDFLKTVVLFVLITLVLTKKEHIEFVLWCLVLSVGFYAGLEGLKFIASGGGHKIEGFATHTLGDRNELSIAFAMMLPLTFYLLAEYGKRSRLLRLGLLGSILLLVVSIIGTQSRGGFIALTVVGGYLFLKSRRKILLLASVLIAGTLVVGLIPSEWFHRMDTIERVGGDSSFMGRVVAWKLSTLLALQHPLLGGGFKSLEYWPVWTLLSLDFHTLSFFPSGDAVPDTRGAHAAHSIYFQVLGEHGFPGLLLFLCILVTAFRKAARVARTATEVGAPEWIASLATALQLSLFAYCVGAAALSFAYFDMTYTLCALIVVLEKRILPAYLPGQGKPGGLA